MTIRSFASLSNENVKLIPIYIGYEKIIEGNSYLSELLGEQKKRESLLDLFKSIKDFKNFLGTVYINVGNPIDLKDFLESELGEKNYKINSPLDRPSWLKILYKKSLLIFPINAALVDKHSGTQRVS